jgi:hypothetical protein
VTEVVRLDTGINQHMHLLYPVPVKLHLYEGTETFQVGHALNSLSIHNSCTRKAKITLTGSTNLQQQPVNFNRSIGLQHKVFDWCPKAVRFTTGTVYNITHNTL